jgi:hypothetical protein
MLRVRVFNYRRDGALLLRMWRSAPQRFRVALSIYTRKPQCS